VKVYIVLVADPYQFEGVEDAGFLPFAYTIDSVWSDNHKAKERLAAIKKEKYYIVDLQEYEVN